MSTVPEVIVAVIVIWKSLQYQSSPTLGVEGIVEKASHEEVQKAAALAQPKMTLIMKELVEQFIKDIFGQKCGVLYR